MSAWRDEIMACERRLHGAALAGDVDGLDAVLADELVFTDQAGRVLSKQDDIALHRSGTLKLDRLEFGDYRTSLLDERTALVNLRADAQGRFDGQPFAAALRFTRIWRREAGGNWRVVVAHCSPLA